MIHEFKQCRRCRVEKPINEFHWAANALDGHRATCADCLSPGRTPGPVNRRRNPEESAEELSSGIRICRLCDLPKALESEFYKSFRANGNVHYSYDCKTCRASPPDERFTHRAPIIRTLNASYHAKHREALLFQKRINGRARIWAQKLRVLAHYGSKCACCGESNPYFLQVDHINGGGGKHRKSLDKHAGWHFYGWLIAQGYPPGYRILCANCNGALGYYGFCPHQGRGKQLDLL